MSNFDNDPRLDPLSRPGAPTTGRSSNSYAIPLALLAIIVIGLGYGYENGWMSSMTEHRAAATDAPSPLPTVKPDSAPAMTPSSPDAARKP